MGKSSNQKGLTRAERRQLKKENKQAKKQETARKSRRRRLAQKSIGTILLLILGGGGGYAFYQWWINEPPGEFVPSLGNAHISSFSTPYMPYNSDPPTSGPHLPSVARWGIHTQPVPKELQVHNLEDGGVVIQYNCLRGKDCNSLRDDLARIVRDYKHVVLAPYDTMDTLIALTAWTRIMKLKHVDETKIRRFIEAYIDIDHHPGRSS